MTEGGVKERGRRSDRKAGADASDEKRRKKRSKEGAQHVDVPSANTAPTQGGDAKPRDRDKRNFVDAARPPSPHARRKQSSSLRVDSDKLETRARPSSLLQKLKFR